MLTMIRGRTVTRDSELVVKLAITERRAKAIEYRLACKSMLWIGKKLAADPAINLDGVAVPHGYGNRRYEAGRPPLSDKAFVAAVDADISKGLVEQRAVLAEAAQQYVALEAQRLDKIAEALWEKCLRGDLAAVDTYLKVMARRAKMLGLDAPDRLRLSVVSGVDAELEQAVEQIMRLAQAEGANPDPVEAV